MQSKLQSRNTFEVFVEFLCGEVQITLTFYPIIHFLQDRHAWKSGLWAMQDTLVLERFVNNELLNIHRDADSDPHVSTV